ncbi:Uncharacterized protein TCM_041516 [Theobroma cacao]|uniref:Uncharacterized protein n=1 Tax=Theobroma cacao TaxID=3641 RepID=A0A061GVP3_THECC|nr:Uncharacterized protein TCM_041516 [Theobroma cacao]
MDERMPCTEIVVATGNWQLATGRCAIYCSLGLAIIIREGASCHIHSYWCPQPLTPSFLSGC